MANKSWGQHNVPPVRSFESVDYFFGPYRFEGPYQLTEKTQIRERSHLLVLDGTFESFRVVGVVYVNRNPVKPFDLPEVSTLRHRKTGFLFLIFPLGAYDEQEAQDLFFNFEKIYLFDRPPKKPCG